MSTMKNLVDCLNDMNVMAFPQKADKDPERKRVTVSAEEGGKRYFLTRVGAGINEDGTAKYQWARGAEMQKQEETKQES